MLRIRCLTCGRTFHGREAYQRHDWREHGGDLDCGEAVLAGARRAERPPKHVDRDELPA
jgi:uncharacterized C2H2 Zn-finger protein